MYVRCYSGPRWTTLFVHIHRHASLADLFRDNYDYKRRQTMAARKRGEGSFSPKWWRNLDPAWPAVALDSAFNSTWICPEPKQGKRQFSSRKRGCVLSLCRVVLLSGTIGARRGILTARCLGNLRVRIGEARNWDTLRDVAPGLQITWRALVNETPVLHALPGLILVFGIKSISIVCCES